MAKQIKLEGTLKDVDVSGAEREIWALNEAADITEKHSFRETYSVAQADTVIPFGGIATAVAVAIRVIGESTEEITVKHSGGSETLTVKPGFLALLTQITALTFSWTLSAPGKTLELEVLIVG